jgi:peptidoglycan/LPS O-acetylase OafA/YrhL
VTFFFVLSGFILTHAYQHSLIQKTLSTKTYLLLRLARIWPLHILTALPFVAYLIYKHGSDILSVVTVNIFLLQSWVPLVKYYISLNAVSWSLSVELFFYVSFIFLVHLSVKFLQKIALLWFVVISTTAALMIFYGYSHWSTGTGEIKVNHWIFYINPVFRLLDFMVGILVYRVAFVKKDKTQDSSLSEIVAVSVLIIGAYVYSTFVFPEILRAQLLYLPLMAYVIYAFSTGTGVISKVLKGKTLVLLGEASFSLYLIHNPIISLANALFLKTSSNIPLLVYAILLTVFCVVASVLTYKFIEKPMHNYLKARIKAL